MQSPIPRCNSKSKNCNPNPSVPEHEHVREAGKETKTKTEGARLRQEGRWWDEERRGRHEGRKTVWERQRDSDSDRETERDREGGGGERKRERGRPGERRRPRDSEAERGREGERERGRETDRGRQRDTHRDRARETETDRERDRGEGGGLCVFVWPPLPHHCCCSVGGAPGFLSLLCPEFKTSNCLHHSKFQISNLCHWLKVRIIFIGLKFELLLLTNKNNSLIEKFKISPLQF
jgi:hypothetical protein